MELTTGQSTQPARIKVFWQPGCSSCLRTKEFLTKQGIEFESIDVHNNPAGLAELLALGAKSVPIVALGGRYTLCQSFNDVIQFLDLKTKLMDPLPPEQLIKKIDIVLNAISRFVIQFEPAQINEEFRNRKRTPRNTAFHVVRVVEMGIEAAQGIELQFESFNDIAPAQWTAEDISAWAQDVRARLWAWWETVTDKKLDFLVSTYYGRRPMHDVFERTTWHAAQHTRQVMLMLETYGIQPNQPLTAADLAGLPVPDEVWDR